MNKLLVGWLGGCIQTLCPQNNFIDNSEEARP